MENIIMKYFKNKQNELFVDPIVENHIGLEELTKEQFDTQLAENNIPTVEQVLQESIATAQAYLDKTDHKFFNRYKAKATDDLVAIEAQRDLDREYIRSNR